VKLTSAQREKLRLRAVALHAAGEGYKPISRVLGVSASTVRRWLNPDEHERHLAASRDAKARRRTPCPACGAQVGYENAGELCGRCKYDGMFAARNERVFAAWNRGEPGPTIAAREGMTATAVQSLVDKHRQRHGDDLALHRRRNRELWDEIQRLWNEEGATVVQVAETLAVTRGNVSQQITAMRNAGIDVRRRQRARRVATHA
jgi:hypothetical protein